MGSIRQWLVYGIIISLTSWNMFLCNPQGSPLSVKERHRSIRAVTSTRHRATWKRLITDYLAKHPKASSDKRPGEIASLSRITGIDQHGRRKHLNALDVIELLKAKNLVRDASMTTTLPPASNFDPTRLENRLFNNPMIAEAAPPSDVQTSLTRDATSQAQSQVTGPSPGFDPTVQVDHVQNGMSFQRANPKQLNPSLSQHQVRVSMSQSQMSQAQNPFSNNQHQQHQQQQHHFHQPSQQQQQQQNNQQQQQQQHNQQQQQQQHNQQQEPPPNLQQQPPSVWQQQQVFPGQEPPPKRNFQQIQQHGLQKLLQPGHHSSHHSRHAQWLQQQKERNTQQQQTKVHQQHEQKQQMNKNGHHLQQHQSQQGQNQHQKHQSHNNMQHMTSQASKPIAQSTGQKTAQSTGQKMTQKEAQQPRQHSHTVQHHNKQVKQSHHPLFNPQQEQLQQQNNNQQGNQNQQPKHTQLLQQNTAEGILSRNQESTVKRSKIRLHPQIDSKFIGNAMAHSKRNHGPPNFMQQQFQFTSGNQFQAQQMFPQPQVANPVSSSPITQQPFDNQRALNFPFQNQNPSSTLLNTIPPVQHSGKASHINPTKPAVNLQSPSPLPSPSLNAFVEQPVVAQPINNGANSRSDVQAFRSQSVIKKEHINSTPHVSKSEQGFHQQPQSPGQSTMDVHLSMMQQAASDPTVQNGRGGEQLTMVETFPSSTLNKGSLTSASSSPQTPSGNKFQPQAGSQPTQSAGHTTLPALLKPLYIEPQVTSPPVAPSSVLTNTPDIPQPIAASAASQTNNLDPHISYHAPHGAPMGQNHGLAATTGTLEPIRVTQSNAYNHGRNSVMQNIKQTSALQPVSGSQQNKQNNAWANTNQQGLATQHSISNLKANGELTPVFVNQQNPYNNQNQQAIMFSNPSATAAVSSQWQELTSQLASTGQQGFSTSGAGTPTGQTPTQGSSNGVSPSKLDPAQAIFDTMFNSQNQRTNIESHVMSNAGHVPTEPSPELTQQNLNGLLTPITQHNAEIPNSKTIASTTNQASSSSQNGHNQPHMQQVFNHAPASFGKDANTGRHQTVINAITVNGQNGNIGQTQTIGSIFPGEPSSNSFGQPQGLGSEVYLGGPNNQEHHSSSSYTVDAIAKPQRTLDQSTASTSQTNSNIVFNKQTQSSNTLVKGTDKTQVHKGQSGNKNQQSQTFGSVHLVGVSHTMTNGHEVQQSMIQPSSHNQLQHSGNNQIQQPSNNQIPQSSNNQIQPSSNNQIEPSGNNQMTNSNTGQPAQQTVLDVLNAKHADNQQMNQQTMNSHLNRNQNVNNHQLNTQQVVNHQLNNNQMNTQETLNNHINNQQAINDVFNSNSMNTQQALNNQMNSQQIMNGQMNSQQAINEQMNKQHAMNNQFNNNQMNTQQAMNNQMNTQHAMNNKMNSQQAMNNQMNTQQALDGQMNTQHALNNQMNAQQAMNNQMNTQQAMNEQMNIQQAIDNQLNNNQINTQQAVDNQFSTNQMNSQQAAKDRLNTNQVTTTQTMKDHINTNQINTQLVVNNQFNNNPTGPKQTVKSHLDVKQMNTKQAEKTQIDGKQMNSNQAVQTELNNNPTITQQTVNNQQNNQMINNQQQNVWTVNNEQVNSNQHMNNQQTMNNNQVKGHLHMNSQQMLNSPSAREVSAVGTTTGSGLTSTQTQVLQPSVINTATGVQPRQLTNTQFTSTQGQSRTVNFQRTGLKGLTDPIAKAKLQANIKRLLDAGFDPEEILEMYRVELG